MVVMFFLLRMFRMLMRMRGILSDVLIAGSFQDGLDLCDGNNRCNPGEYEEAGKEQAK